MTERDRFVTLRIRLEDGMPDLELWDWPALLDEPRESVEVVKPQVYVSVNGGIADAMETTAGSAGSPGAVDIVQVDWDLFEDNDPSDEEIAEFRAELERLEPRARADAMLSFNEEVDKRRRWKEQQDEHYAEVRRLRLEDARRLIAEEEQRAGQG